MSDCTCKSRPSKSNRYNPCVPPMDVSSELLPRKFGWFEYVAFIRGSFCTASPGSHSRLPGNAVMPVPRQVNVRNSSRAINSWAY